MRRIELLSPARDLSCGIAAIDHGADAVYIGAPRHSARAAAACSVDDIRRLSDYAHLYGARVYVALNTLIADDEMPEVERLVWQLYRAGADALIVQDMGITRLHLPPIALHASTQTDNRTADKVRFLAGVGFRRVVLARELSLDEIGEIHRQQPEVQLEVFVHGALCVSYSGQCYASQACFKRSANRGECAQFCRLPFTLTDEAGRVLSRRKHLLSLRDLCRIDQLEDLLDAGVTSLKIEGRLKGVGYVKNITAAYRRRLDEIFSRRPEYAASSSGHCTYSFEPRVEKSFNRGFTSYFIDGQRRDVAGIDTPKAMGEPVATVVGRQGRRQLRVKAVQALHNGDGLCYLDPRGDLHGFRVNRTEGDRLFTAEEVEVSPGTRLFRNHDQAFEAQLQRPSAARRISLSWQVDETPFGFALTAIDEDGYYVRSAAAIDKTPALKPQEEAIRSQLLRIGNTLFETREADIHIRLSRPLFIPASILAATRRRVTDGLTSLRRLRHRPLRAPHPAAKVRNEARENPYPEPVTDYRLNVMNAEARRFYAEHGVSRVEPAFELQPPESVAGRPLMLCRHCVRFSLGLCPRYQHPVGAPRGPLYLQTDDGRRFRLDFDCRRCLMTVSLCER